MQSTVLILHKNHNTKINVYGVVIMAELLQEQQEKAVDLQTKSSDSVTVSRLSASIVYLLTNLFIVITQCENHFTVRKMVEGCVDLGLVKETMNNYRAFA